jgi:putative transcriptional regulator
MSKESIIAIPADPDDADDRAVSEADVKRALMGRRIRQLRHRLGLSQAEFATRFGIPLANIRQYEIGRTMPPPAVQSYLRVIEADPERVAEALAAA